MKSMLAIPMYNEQDNVKPLVDAIQKVISHEKLELEIVLLNDGSTDDTLAKMVKMKDNVSNLVIVTRSKNKGMAATLWDGIQYAIKHEYDVVVFMDGDLTHNPSYLPAMMKSLEYADMVIGSRYVKGGGMKDVPVFRVFISKAGNSFLHTLLGLKVRDSTSGYRAIKTDLLKLMVLRENNFVIQLEEVAEATRLRAKIAEVPIILTTRIHGSSKFNLSMKAIMRYVTFAINRVLI
jgi:dolichol-phosphate mannosyltransferase